MEAAEAAQLDLLTAARRLDDVAERGFDDDAGVFPHEVGVLGHLVHELRSREPAVWHGLVVRQMGVNRGLTRACAAVGEMMAGTDGLQGEVA